MSKRKVNDSERIAQFSAISRLAPLGSRITLALTTKGGTDNALITVHEDRPDCPAMHLSRSGPRPRVPLGKYPLRAKLCLAADESMPNVAIYVILESGMITVDTFKNRLLGWVYNDAPCVDGPVVRYDEESGDMVEMHGDSFLEEELPDDATERWEEDAVALCIHPDPCDASIWS